MGETLTPKRFFLTDYESGESYEVSERHYNEYHEALARVMPKVDNIPGKVMIFGTGGDFDGHSMFKDLFFNPEITDNNFNHGLTQYFMPREFKEPDPLTDEDIMPSGKHKGLKMIDVPAKHLLYIYENKMCSDRVKVYVEANLDVIKQQAKSDQ